MRPHATATLRRVSLVKLLCRTVGATQPTHPSPLLVDACRVAFYNPSIMRLLCAIFASLALACGGEKSAASGDAAEEAPVVPGSTCESSGDPGVVNLDITFAGSLLASQIVAVTRWANADPSCAPSAPLWMADIGNMAADATWKEGSVYVREREELLVNGPARIGVVMDCEAQFLSAQLRLDTANDGHGKLMANCTKAIP
jgi:hypothetical protein